LPEESGWHPVTLGSSSHVLELDGAVAFVKQQYASAPFTVVGTLHTNVASAWSGGAEPDAQL
jgi:hypothetical protein